MKINFNINQLKQDYVRTMKAEYGEQSKESQEAESLGGVALVKKAKKNGFDVMVYIDGVEYDDGEKMSSYEAKCAAEKYFASL